MYFSDNEFNYNMNVFRLSGGWILRKFFLNVQRGQSTILIKSEILRNYHGGDVYYDMQQGTALMVDT